MKTLERKETTIKQFRIDVKLNSKEKNNLKKSVEILKSIMDQIEGSEDVITVDGYEMCKAIDIIESRFLLEALSD